LVELGVQPNISRPHRLAGEIDDRFHGPGGTLFEGTAMHELVQMNSVFASYDVLKSGALAASLGWCEDPSRENVKMGTYFVVFCPGLPTKRFKSVAHRMEQGGNLPCLEFVYAASDEFWVTGR